VLKRITTLEKFSKPYVGSNPLGYAF